jgi:hypothetical protein
MRRTIETVYALVHTADGRWLLLNRHYKPHGVDWPRNSWADYDTCPGRRLLLTAAHLQQLDGGGTPHRPSDRIIWLYHDGSDPRLGAAHRGAYERRVRLLALADTAEVV